MATAKDITAVLRELYPVPVRLSTRAAGRPGYFLIRLPSAPAASLNSAWGNGYLTRHLGTRTVILFARNIARRDCGRDVELTIRIGDTPTWNVERTRDGEVSTSPGFPGYRITSVYGSGHYLVWSPVGVIGTRHKFAEAEQLVTKDQALVASSAQLNLRGQQS